MVGWPGINWALMHWAVMGCARLRSVGLGCDLRGCGKLGSAWLGCNGLFVIGRAAVVLVSITSYV